MSTVINAIITIHLLLVSIAPVYFISYCYVYRFLTPREIALRKQELIEAGEGHKTVRPIQSQNLSKIGMSVLIQRKTELSHHCLELFSGMAVTLQEENLPGKMLYLQDDVFLSMDGVNNVNVRSYYKKNGRGPLKAGPTGRFICCISYKLQIYIPTLCYLA